VALEKPFGRDERDFLALEESLRNIFPEEHVFYVDHYLGKGTVQNLVVLKAENFFIERLLSREFVQEVHIGVFEEEGVGERGAFYEETGAIKDIFQNHLLQLFTLLAVDIPPLCAEDQKECARFFFQLSRERARLLSQVRLPESREVQLGQYAGYREEVRNPSSLRETFFFFPLFLDTERWRGVPFYVASGKKTAQKRSFVEVLFHSVVTPPNRLIIEIQLEERIDLVVSVRKPQRELESTPVTLNFTYSGAFKANTPEAYEKILHDFLYHDRTLFPDSSFIQEAWRLTDRLLENLRTHPPAFRRYREGVLTPEILFREKRIPDEMCLG
jgi:glucose-6-phosphate 1-dehydrogenase